MGIKIFFLITALALIAVVILYLTKVWTQSSSSSAESSQKGTIVRQVALQIDFTGAKVRQEDLLQGCARKDCIPSIDAPIFETSQEADTWLNPEDQIFALKIENEFRAYPQRILNWHEIVNDRVSDKAIAVTFCPLCGSAVAFERVVDGKVTELGVSGKLHESDLVMYDRYEGNLWQQITGEAIVGPAARRNEKLRPIPIITTTWQSWRTQYPNTLVLSRSTGFVRNYDQYPYGTYESDNKLLFGVKNLDKSLPIKSIVYGIEIANKAKAYPEKIFESKATITDLFAGQKITLTKQKSGEITVKTGVGNDEIIPVRLFWFAWAAFHPETELYNL